MPSLVVAIDAHTAARALTSADLTPAARDAFVSVFAAADVNGDGSLTRDEAAEFVESALTRLGAPP
eukprot:gene7080-43196_t